LASVNPEMQSNPDRALVLLLLSLLLGNPLVVFLLSDRWWLALLTPLLILLVLALVHPNRILLIWIINGFALLSLGLHSEVAFRFGFSDYIIENLYSIRSNFYFNRPNLLKKLEDKEYQVTYKTNAQGFRILSSSPFTDSLTTCDWLFLGDSFTQGAQVEFEELYTSQLYRHFPDKVIVNAGISGFGLADEYHYFVEEGYRLKPKKVFLQLCSFNDFMNVGTKRSAWNDYLMEYSDLARFLLYGIRYKSPGELPLGRWTEPFYPSREENAIYNVFYKESSPQKEKDLQLFKDYLVRLYHAVKSANAELYIILVPTKEQTYHAYLKEVLNGFRIEISQVDMERPNKLVRTLADSLGVTFIDLLPGYYDQPQRVFFDYDEHLNALGHRVTADLIAAFLQPDSLSPRPLLLSQHFWGERYPQFSGDGNWLTYQSLRDGNMEVFKSDSALQHPVRLTYNNVTESHPMLAPDSAFLVLTEGEASQLNTKVVRMDPDGNNRTYVTGGKYEFGAIPTISKSGRYLSFAGWAFDPIIRAYSNPSIVLMDLRTGRRASLTQAKEEDWRPVMSPDETQLVYISKRQGQFDLYIIDLGSGTRRPLTNTAFDEWDPHFSPDGTRLVYAARKMGNWDLFELEIRTGMVRQLTQTLGDEWDPVYSPRGDRVAYAGKFGLFQCIYQLPLAPSPILSTLEPHTP